MESPISLRKLVTCSPALSLSQELSSSQVSMMANDLPPSSWYNPDAIHPGLFWLIVKLINYELWIEFKADLPSTYLAYFNNFCCLFFEFVNISVKCEEYMDLDRHFVLRAWLLVVNGQWVSCDWDQSWSYLTLQLRVYWDKRTALYLVKTFRNYLLSFLSITRQITS